MKKLGKVKICWSANFAYSIGLIATDGNLSKDERHISFTSKDLEQVQTFIKCLDIKNKIRIKSRGGEVEKKYFEVQFGDIIFYKFLNSIGLQKAKSKNLGALDIPNSYFPDFFRGCLDGDGNISVTVHPESVLPQLRMRIYSASPQFLKWLKQMVSFNFEINTGWIQPLNLKKLSALSFGKRDSIKIINKIYYKGVKNFLKRKFNIIRPYLID